MKDNAKITLTIGQLKTLVNEVHSMYWGSNSNYIEETVEQTLLRLGMVNEMAFTKKEYENKVFGLRIQIVQNWCLCKWCQLYSPLNDNFEHWKTELIAHLTDVHAMDIKGKIDKGKTLTNLLVNQCDLAKPDMINRIVSGKFNEEKITDGNQKEAVVSEFVKSIQDIIETLSNNSIDIRQYVKATFNPSMS